MIIGKNVLFIEQVWRPDGRGVSKNVEHHGIVIDKFRDYVTDDGIMHEVDFYLVQSPDGLLRHFRPHQANSIITDSNA